MDIQSEHVFPLGDLPRQKCIPRRRGGKRLHKSTGFRWVQRGLRGVRLEAIRIGGTLCTSVEAVQRFFDALTHGDQVVRDHHGEAVLTDSDRVLDADGIS